MSAKGQMALAWAEAKAQGLPYIWAATGPSAYDCSGLTQTAWKVAGVPIPRTSQEQANIGVDVPLSAAQPGDLVLFSYPDEGASNPAPANHVALYVDPSTVFAASRPGIPIGFAPLDTAHVYRVVRPGGGGSTPAGAANAAAYSFSASTVPVSDSPPAQLAGYQAALNLTPWGIPLNPLKLPGFFAGKLGSLSGAVGGGLLQGVVTGVVDALGPLLLTLLIAAAAFGLIGIGVWRALQPARQKVEAGAEKAAKVAAVAAV